MDFDESARIVFALIWKVSIIKNYVQLVIILCNLALDIYGINMKNYLVYGKGRGISSYTARFGDTYTSFLALKGQKRQKRLIKHRPYHAYMLICHYAYMLILYKLCM